MESLKEFETALKNLYYKCMMHECVNLEKLPGAGSNRTYYRLTGDNGRTAIGTVCKNLQENQTFANLSEFLGYDNELNVPQVYGTSGSCYLQSDLGDKSLFDYISDRDSAGNLSEKAIDLIRKTIHMLPDFQWANHRNKCKYYIEACFDIQFVMWDLNYFKYCFLKPSGIDFDEKRLEYDFRQLADRIIKIQPQVLVLRDFQSRNIMIVDDKKPYVIDFQGALMGPCQYDLVSFLWQVRAGFSPEFREEMIEEYLLRASRYLNIKREQFMAGLNLMVVFRTMQVLGAYGFRGLVEGKPHFLKSLYPAIKQLEQIVAKGLLDDFPYLKQIFCDVSRSDKFRIMQPYTDKLLVRINSFGFRKSGIPTDFSGNGGGFVFDCRALPNPGKYNEYSQLTGMDDDVVKFLEKHDTVKEFLESVFNLANMSVARYMERGFKDLMINFGCTGGQHRSVYCAEKLAQYICERYDVEIILTHVEQGVVKKNQAGL
ncbi:RNase adapter RapZ [uncultured Muribaculum sp.]|uniref:RapZ C-terminal domain-containing protein n=1 Tax=uncultured Muribaculum sp. TaxID=1918613 RepID=UPI0026707F15|nr:RNase adapter RapZ [uncultured Muribaculum sp.]